MRIAICGGGAAGLSAALHLAELVERGLVAGPIDVYAGIPPPSRPIGVGLWSTALTPLQNSWRCSHQLVWEDLLHLGRWVGAVGYKTPSGRWLAMSELPTTTPSASSPPALLFLREQDMLSSLRKAVHLEEMRGTIMVHQGRQSTVEGIDEQFVPHFSAPLKLQDGISTERDYHLIVAADGMNSTLRQRYGGHRVLRRRLSGASALGSPFDARDERYDGPSDEASWDVQEQSEANTIEDRGYTVFRGNANVSVEEAGMNGVSFQTWGEGNSMRFATVPLSYADSTGRVEQQVWFITTSDANITQETDPDIRKEKLLQAFSTWHDPIHKLIEATPANGILFEKAMAHRHSVGPVPNLNRVLRQVYKVTPPSSGPGPAVVFIGDSFMTVDPILAQGFTMAMEAGAALAPVVEASITQFPAGIAFDPYALRILLQERHDARNGRLLHLLQATGIVQALGQPQSGVVGSLSRYLIRPLMLITPDFIKRPIFDALLKYSLGIR